MNSENGLPKYSISPSAKFTRAVKVLKKSYKSKREAKTFIACIGDIVEGLSQYSQPKNSRREPWPSNLSYSGWEFRKLVFSVPGRSGAAGEGRLMYLVNDHLRIIHLFWLYTHEELEKRPPEKDMKTLMRELLENSENTTD
jgi:hypothetical protein